MRSSRAHCVPELAKRIGEKLGEEDWRGGLARYLAKRIGEEEDEEKKKEEEEEKQTALIKSIATLTWQVGKYRPTGNALAAVAVSGSAVIMGSPNLGDNIVSCKGLKRHSHRY